MEEEREYSQREEKVSSPTLALYFLLFCSNFILLVTLIETKHDVSLMYVWDFSLFYKIKKIRYISTHKYER